MLKQNGLNGFICSNKFFRAKYGTNLRAYILEHTTIQQIVDFNGVKVFEDATVDSAITILKKQNSNENSSFRVFDSKLESFKEINQADLSKSSFTFADKKELEIKKKIESVGTPLKEWDIKINYGIKTGFNEAFIINGKKRDELIAFDSKSAEIIKPILRGRDIKRYGHKFADLWLIFTYRGIKIDNYPIIKSHLNQYYNQLSKRKNIKEWYELQSSPNQDIISLYENKKYIAWLELTDRGKFGIVEKIYSLNSLTVINPQNINYKFLVSILNSNIMNFYFSSICMSSGVGTNQWRKNKVELLPIPKILLEEQEPFIKLVDEILEAKEKVQKYKKYFDTLNAVEKIELTDEIAKLEEKVSLCENEIDTMVYKLYGLNSDEITIIMGFKG
jgi:hypothetical protein